MATSAPARASDAATTAPMRRVPVISAALPASSIHYLYIPAQPRATRGPGGLTRRAPAVKRPVARAGEEQAEETGYQQQRVLEAVTLPYRARPIQKKAPLHVDLPRAD